MKYRSLCFGLIVILHCFACNKIETKQNPAGTLEKSSDQVKTIEGEFDEIDVSSGIVAEIYKSDFEKASVSAEDNLPENLDLRIENGTLSIGLKPTGNFKKNGLIKAQVFVRDFQSVKATSSASIRFTENFSGKSIAISASSGATITGNLNANLLGVDLSSSASAKLNIVCDLLKADISSGSTCTLSGDAKNGSIALSSSAALSAKDLLLGSATVMASSGATASITVQNSLTAEATSSAEVNFYRKGKLEKINKRNSSGGIIKDKT